MVGLSGALQHMNSQL